MPHFTSLDSTISAVVIDNVDPEGAYRVKVKFPWVTKKGQTEELTMWAKIALPMAGKGRGFWALPEVDDEVIVTFMEGNPDRPVVVGSMWNGEDKSPGSGGPSKIQTGRGQNVAEGDNRNTEIGGDDVITIGGFKRETVKANYLLNAGGIIIKADRQVTIQVGKARLTMNPDGNITLSGKLIEDSR